jgi:uncharacterized protein (DUF4415 family)
MKKTENSKIETSVAAKAAGLRRIPRRHIARRGEVTLKDCKVKITINIDADILEHFKNRANAKNAAPYQTQINTELRRIMEQDLTGKTENLSKFDLREALLNDTELLELLKERLAA